MKEAFRVLMYRPKLGDGKWLDNAILACTLQYNPPMWNKPKLWSSHAEIWTPDETGNFDNGQAFTSTMGQAGGENRPKEDGVVLRPVHQVIKHLYRWYYYPVYCSAQGYERLQTWQDVWLRQNKGYNKSDIVDFFNPFKRRQDLRKWICSGVTWASICVAFDTQPILPKKRYLGHSIQELPSPLRLSRWLLDAPAEEIGNPIDLETGKVLYTK